MAIKAGFVSNSMENDKYHQSVSDFYFLNHCFITHKQENTEVVRLVLSGRGIKG